MWMSIWYLKVTSLCLVSRFQTLIVLSSDEETILQASACKHRITPVWPSEVIQSKVDKQTPVSKFHSLMVESREPEMTLLPSIDKVVTESSWPFKVLRMDDLMPNIDHTLMVLSSDPERKIPGWAFHGTCMHKTRPWWPLSVASHRPLFRHHNFKVSS